ncbi:hypothetical protein QTP70_031019, partial [Hemibagrus guttatus]
VSFWPSAPAFSLERMAAQVKDPLDNLTRSHGVRVVTVVGVEEWCLAAGQVVSHRNVLAASRMNSAVVLFVKTLDNAVLLTQKGIVPSLLMYREELLGLIVRPYAAAVGPGFLLVHNNAQPHVARVCRWFLEDEGIDTIEWPARSPDLNPIEHFWDIMFRSIQRRQVAPQTVQELSDALAS